MASIRILIADDHGVVAEGLRHLVGANPDMEVIGLAENGREAARMAFEAAPDVVLMDHAMPVLNGTEATRLIRERLPHTRVIMLSMYSDAVHVYRALQAGATGYIVKKSVAKEVVDAILAVHRGGRYLSRQLAHVITDQMVDRSAPEDPLDRLSSRERQVLQLLAEGHSIAEHRGHAGALSEDRRDLPRAHDGKARHLRPRGPRALRDTAGPDRARLSGLVAQCVDGCYDAAIAAGRTTGLLRGRLRSHSAHAASSVAGRPSR